MFRKLLLLMFMLMFFGGCDNQDMAIDFANKTEYSILQHYEYTYRNAEQNKPYMVFERALNSDYTVVAFPIKDRPKGYVVILAQVEGVPKIKVMTNADFVLTKEVYIVVKEEISLSNEVDLFIAAHVR